MTSGRPSSTPSTNNLRQTMRAQVDALIDRLHTVQAIAADPSRTGDPGSRPVGGHSDPTSTRDREQRLAQVVLAQFNDVRNELAQASATARHLVPEVVPCCFWCGEPTGDRKTVRSNGELYHASPCEMRARRVAKEASQA